MSVAVALLRHGVPAIAPGIAYGALDVAASVPPVPRELRRWRRATLWSSPSRRCLLFARALGRVLGRRPRVDRRLRELALGRWEGVAWDALPRRLLDAWARAPLGRGAPGGDTAAALLARVRGFARLLRRHGGRHVVVTHGGPLRLLPALLRNRPVRLAAAPAPPFGAMLIVTDARRGRAAPPFRPSPPRTPARRP